MRSISARFRQIFWLLFLLFFFHSTLRAQYETAEEVKQGLSGIMLNLNFPIGLPQQQFRDKLDATGFGVGGNLLFESPNAPVQAGIDFSYTTYQREKLDLEIDVGGFFEDFDLITKNNILAMHGMLRFEPPLNYFIRPYADGLVGTKLFYTRTRLINRDNSDEGVVQNDNDQRDWAFSYGGALGVKIYLFHEPALTIDLRCAYLMGANANFMAKRADADSLVIEDTIDAFEEKRSPTHLLIPQIGVTVELQFFEE